MKEGTEVALGRIAAIEFAVAALIASHPAPETLVGFLSEVGPALREDLETKFADSPGALRVAQGSFDQFVRAARSVAAARAQDGAPTRRQ